MTTTDLSTATEDQIEQLRRRARNDVTREIMAIGVTLTHEQADDLGEMIIDWMTADGGLCLGATSTEDGVEFAPRRTETAAAMGAGPQLRGR